MTRQAKIFCWLALAALLVPFGAEAATQATQTGFNVLNPVLDTYKPYQVSWAAIVKPAALQLFMLLVGIDFAWTAVNYVLEKNDLSEIGTSLVKKFFTFGFFLGLLQMSQTWIPDIINSFSKLGQDASGVGAVATPDAIVDRGYQMALGIFDVLGQVSLIDRMSVSLPMEFLGLVIFTCFLYIALQLMAILIESYIVIGGGVILLGFGGSRWTTDFATKYLQYSVSVGVRLFVLYLIVGVGQTLISGFHIEKAHLIESMLKAFGSALVYAFLVFKSNGIASGMISGVSQSSAGDLMGAALTTGAVLSGAGAMGGQMLGGIGLAGANGAAGINGIQQAMKAGMNSAGDVGLSGAGAGIHAAKEMFGAGLNMAGESLAGAFGNVGGSTFDQKVSSSFGSGMADRIEAGRGGSMSATQPPPQGGSFGFTPATANNSQPAGSSVNSASSSSAPASSSSQGASSAPYIPPPGTGEVSGAAISGGGSEGSGAGNGNGGQNSGPQLHEKFRDLQGYTPTDNTQVAAPQINLGHTAD